jgi:PilY1 beta-propeller domain
MRYITSKKRSEVSMIRKKYMNIKTLLIVMVILVLGIQIQSDDKELFMGANNADTSVRPNVMILMDNSGSMNSIITFPAKGLDKIAGTDDDGYDPANIYPGYVDGFQNSRGYEYVSSTQWFARWVYSGKAEKHSYSYLQSGWDDGDFSAYNRAGNVSTHTYRVSSDGKHFRTGDKVIYYYDSGNVETVATLSSKYKDSSSNWWFVLKDVEGGTIVPGKGHFQQSPDNENWTAIVIKMYGTTDEGNSVRWPDNYVRWIFLEATDEQRAAVNFFSTYATFNVNATEAEKALKISDCATSSNDDLSDTNPRYKLLFTRIQTAREVICSVATKSNSIVRLGLYKFKYDDGGSLVSGLNDMADESSELNAYKNTVYKLAADAWTPLAEALADVWYYYKPGPDSKTYWPVNMEIDGSTVNHNVNSTNVIQYWCQSNYTIIMTDGEATYDSFDDSEYYTKNKYNGSIFNDNNNYPIKRQNPWNDWSNGWGDPDNNDDPENGYRPAGGGTATYCPNDTCWLTQYAGTDLLDDVAYFLRNQDMYPDYHYTEWPGDQKIFTYTIGFNFDNDMLRQTAINGEGAYYTADSYEELVAAFQNVITSINLRNFAFSAITAPRKTSTATNADQTVSYVGYFMPSQASSLWEGHLLSFELQDDWGFDSDGSNSIEPEEYVYDSEELCLNASGGADCERWVRLAIGHEWDAADKVPANRNLYTHDTDKTANVAFDKTNRDTIRNIVDKDLIDLDIDNIIDTISQSKFRDVFHSDVGFVGPPPFGKQFISNIDPPGVSDQKYSDYYEANKNRSKVLYMGTNDGIMHMLYADGLNAGIEKWGFLPNEILPSLKTIVLDKEHTYTVDGRLSASDIWFNTGSKNEWRTLLVYGLRRGGKAYYGMDITQVDSTPNMLWKFKDSTHSGESWGKPSFGRVRYLNGNVEEDKWVIFLTGGFAFNSENSSDKEGKAIFMVDAANGNLLWSIAYDADNGAADTVTLDGQDVIETSASGNKNLTKSSLFNFSIPSALTVVDSNNDGYTDTIYFANVGGHLFKTDITSLTKSEWKTYVMFKRAYMKNKHSTTISKIVLDVFTVGAKGFSLGDTIMGTTSHAYGYITEIDNKNITVITEKGTFVEKETIVSRTYDPIYLSPAVAFDPCYQLWVTFGTGDRDRPLSNLNMGRYAAIKDNGTTNIIEDSDGDIVSATLQKLTMSDAGVLVETDLAATVNGWYLNFLNTGEKIFDPEPIILPDINLIPHIYFNTYQPPEETTKGTAKCDAPDEGIMKIYDIALTSCGFLVSVEGERTTGRVAGGGIYEGKEYVIYKSQSGEVADVPGGEGGNFVAEPKLLPYSGGIVFWKEKKR